MVTVHPSHAFTCDWCEGKYCTGCGSFIGSLDAGIAEPCAMDRRAVVEEVVPGPDWFELNRSAG
jgi:hypothetical protein